MKFGVALGRLNPAFFLDASVAADNLGYESVWLPEHLVFTAAMSRSPHPGETHPPVPPETPIFDAFAYLAFLAARTERVRLGTHVYNLGLRHVHRGAVQTLDIVSEGRFEFGIGASGSKKSGSRDSTSTRGRRLDESLAVTSGSGARSARRRVLRPARSCSSRRCSSRGRRSWSAARAMPLRRRAAADGWIGGPHGRVRGHVDPRLRAPGLPGGRRDAGPAVPDLRRRSGAFPGRRQAMGRDRCDPPRGRARSRSPARWMG
jgi:hypothetical protein